MSLRELGVDHVHAARRLDDRHVHATAIGSYGDVIGMAAQRDALGDFQRLAIDHVERALRFVADVDSVPSGATATPWFTSMPSITPTTLLVTGSMM